MHWRRNSSRFLTIFTFWTWSYLLKTGFKQVHTVCVWDILGNLSPDWKVRAVANYFHVKLPESLEKAYIWVLPILLFTCRRAILSNVIWKNHLFSWNKSWKNWGIPPDLGPYLGSTKSRSNFLSPTDTSK